MGGSPLLSVVVLVDLLHNHSNACGTLGFGEFSLFIGAVVRRWLILECLWAGCGFCFGGWNKGSLENEILLLTSSLFVLKL